MNEYLVSSNIDHSYEHRMSIIADNRNQALKEYLRELSECIYLNNINLINIKVHISLKRNHEKFLEEIKQ